MPQEIQLKEVSKAKHHILEKYFPAWAKILGSRHPTLVYVDCFAGPGQYAGGEEGSPLIILNKARELVQKSDFSIVAIFVEKNAATANTLRSQIPKDLPDKVNAVVLNEDAHDFVQELLNVLPEEMPAFFFIDPYGHPLTIPVMNQILSRPRTEILLNLMWYALNMHLNNPRVKGTITKMFGDSNWLDAPFAKQSGSERETAFVDYFLFKLDAEYKLKFRVRFSPEDRVPGGQSRTKYYLIHLSNHPKAALLMKEVMWRIGDEEGTFDYSATHQGVLVSSTPNVEELIEYLKRRYLNSGRKLTFNHLREETWELPFIEKRYREAIRRLEKAGEVRVDRIDSGKNGIKGGDLLIF